MAASYPTSAKSFAPIVDSVDYPQATQVNQAYDEITAVETQLVANGIAAGTFPKAVFAARSVLGIPAATTTYYGSSYDSTTETDSKFPCPVAGTVKNLYVSADGAISGANTAIFTVRKNGADQAVTCTVTAGALTANDTTHSFTVALGDLLSVKLVTSASAETRKHCLSFTVVP